MSDYDPAWTATPTASPSRTPTNTRTTTATATRTATATSTRTATPTSTATATQTATATSTATATPTATPCGTLNGVISSSMTLAHDCTYLVTGNTAVSAGSTLTVERGVSVKFTDKYYILFDGKLVANGTAAQPVRFTSNSPNPQKGDWKRLIFRTDASTMSHTVVEYGGNNQGDTGTYSWGALFVESVLTIDSSAIQSNTTTAIYGTGTVTITNSTISGNWGGLAMYNGGKADLISNTVSFNGPSHAISSISSAGPIRIYNNLITDNSASGTVHVIQLDGSGSVLEGNTIFSNKPTDGSAVLGAGTGATIRYNTFCRNVPHANPAYPESSRTIIAVGGNPSPSYYFSENNIEIPSTGYAVSTWNTGGSLGISGDYWYTTDSSQISAAIYDYYEDPLRARLIFEPISTVPIPSAPPQCPPP